MALLFTDYDNHVVFTDLVTQKDIRINKGTVELRVSGADKDYLSMVYAPAISQSGIDGTAFPVTKYNEIVNGAELPLIASESLIDTWFSANMFVNP